MSMSVQSPTVVWVTVQPAKRRRSEMSKRNKINKNGGGNGRNGKMRQKGAGESSEEVVVNAIKHQPRAAYEEYHLKGVPNQDQRLHDLAVVALQAIYSMPKVLLSLCSTAKPFTHTSHGLQLKLC